MEIFINNHASIPIYEQISSQIKALIINGELKAGEALPSIRGLAKSLHISVLTVQKSYDVLQKVNIPWWRSHPIHENRATKSIWTEPCNPLLRATKSTKRATSA